MRLPLEAAFKEAMKSNQKRSKMSAMTLDGKVKAYNYNLIGGYKLSIHAEEHLIIRASRYGVKLEGSTVLIFRINGNQKSKPCRRCLHLLQRAGVKTIIYCDGEQYVWEKI